MLAEIFLLRLQNLLRTAPMPTATNPRFVPIALPRA
jgi:hypothetical protein